MRVGERNPEHSLVLAYTRVAGALESGEPSEDGLLGIEQEEVDAAILAPGPEDAARGDETAITQTNELGAAEGGLQYLVRELRCGVFGAGVDGQFPPVPVLTGGL